MNWPAELSSVVPGLPPAPVVAPGLPEMLRARASGEAGCSRDSPEERRTHRGGESRAGAERGGSRRPARPAALCFVGFGTAGSEPMVGCSIVPGGNAGGGGRGCCKTATRFQRLVTRQSTHARSQLFANGGCCSCTAPPPPPCSNPFPQKPRLQFSGELREGTELRVGDVLF